MTFTLGVAGNPSVRLFSFAASLFLAAVAFDLPRTLNEAAFASLSAFTLACSSFCLAYSFDDAPSRHTTIALSYFALISASVSSALSGFRRPPITRISSGSLERSFLRAPCFTPSARAASRSERAGFFAMSFAARFRKAAFGFSVLSLLLRPVGAFSPWHARKGGCDGIEFFNA